VGVGDAVTVLVCVAVLVGDGIAGMIVGWRVGVGCRREVTIGPMIAVMIVPTRPIKATHMGNFEFESSRPFFRAAVDGSISPVAS
jgi:hypothetical protein